MLLCRFAIIWKLSIEIFLLLESFDKKWLHKRSEAQSIQYTKNKYHRKSNLEIVNILPNVLLHLSRSTFSFELLSFIYHPSVRRAAACRQCSHRLCLVNSTSDIHETTEGCRSTEIDLRVGGFFVCPPPPFLQTTKQLGIKTAICAPWSWSHI